MKFFEKKFTGLHLRVCSRSLFFLPPSSPLGVGRELQQKGNGGDSINQNSQFLGVTVRFTERAACSKRKSLSPSNVSSACMRSFTFHIVALERSAAAGKYLTLTAHCFTFSEKNTHTHTHAPAHTQNKPIISAGKSEQVNFNCNRTTLLTLLHLKKNGKHCFVASPSHLQNV